MTTQEVANRLVALCRIGQNDAAIVELYAQDAVSIEAANSPDKITKGIDNIRKKGEVLRQTIKEYHGASISEPLVAGAFFSVQMAMEVTFTNGHRVNMQEVCVYKVKNGKIVEEQFFYDADSE
jgi:ketosteroid isomerase-like protein